MTTPKYFFLLTKESFLALNFHPDVLWCFIWSPDDFLWGLHKYFSDKCDCIFYFSMTFNLIILLKNLSHPLSILSIMYANPPKQEIKNIHWWATTIKLLLAKIKLVCWEPFGPGIRVDVTLIHTAHLNISAAETHLPLLSPWQSCSALQKMWLERLEENNLM